MNEIGSKAPPSLQAQTIPARPVYDAATDVNNPVPGWPSLAKRIISRNEFEAFPSFSDLAIKSLLYYQAELVHLRKKLHKAEWADFRRDPPDDAASIPAARFAEDINLLFEARDQAIQENTQLPEQWILIEQIRTTLDKYSQ